MRLVSKTVCDVPHLPRADAKVPALTACRGDFASARAGGGETSVPEGGTPPRAECSGGQGAYRSTPGRRWAVGAVGGLRYPQIDVWGIMSDTARRWALVIGGIALAGMATLTACGKDGDEKPSPTPPATSTSVTSTSGPASSSVASPTEKGLTPGGANSFSPTVKAPAAPTALPGRNHTG